MSFSRCLIAMSVSTVFAVSYFPLSVYAASQAEADNSAQNRQNTNKVTDTFDDEETETIGVVGHKMTLINQDAAASISVLGAEDIARNQEAELTQILRELPNVDISGSVAPLSGQPVIRGLTGERIFISVDNVKRKSESDGSTSVAVINSLGVDPSQLKQVQVLRGPDSLTVGSGAVGGSIRLVTKDAADYLGGKNGVGARISTAYQSASEALVHTATGFYLDDEFDSVLHVSYSAFSDLDVVAKNDVDPDEAPVESKSTIKNDSKRENISWKTRWFIDDAQSLLGKIDWSATTSNDQPYGQRVDYDIRYPMLREDYKNDYLESFVNYVYTPDNELIDFDMQAIYSKKTIEEVSRGFIQIGENQRIFDKVSDGETTRYGVRMSNLSNFDSAFPHKVAVEFNWERETFTQHEIDKGTQGTFYGDSDAENLSFSVIDQASFFNEKVLTTAGLRYDSYERSSNKFADYAQNDDGQLSSEIGVTFKATDFLNLYVKYAEAFRAPSVQELYKKDEWRCHIGGKICYQEPQPDLMPETSVNFEAGFGLSWNDLAYADVLSLKVIYFDNRIHNYINNVPFMFYYDENGVKQPGSPGPGPSNGVPMATHRDYSAKNIGKLMSEGIEAEVDYRIGDVDMYLGYSTMDMDVEGMPNFFLGTIDYAPQPYTEAPADKLVMNVNYQVAESLNVGMQWLAYRKQLRLPEQYLTYGYGTQSYQLYNLNATYQGSGVLDGVTLVMGVDNLTDTRYLRAPASESSDPAEAGRNVKITLSYQF